MLWAASLCSAAALVVATRPSQPALLSSNVLRASPILSSVEDDSVEDDSAEEARRSALRLPPKQPDLGPDDTGDPLGGGEDEFFRAAEARVRRRARDGHYEKLGTTSRSLPLVALLAQVGLGGALSLGFGYCWLVRAEAEAGAGWAVEALSNADAWFIGPARLVFSQPPGGPLTLVYVLANALNVLRCLPLLFDRVLVARLPSSSPPSPPSPPPP